MRGDYGDRQMGWKGGGREIILTEICRTVSGEDEYETIVCFYSYQRDWSIQGNGGAACLKETRGTLQHSA